MRKALSVVYLFYAAIIFISLMLIAFPLVLLISFLLPGLTGKKIILVCLRAWAFLFSCLSFFWVVTHGKQHIDHKRPHIYVGNHGSYLDAVAVCLCIPQHFFALGKIEMTKVPVFGMIYKRIVVMIDRSSAESRAHSVQILKEEIAIGQSILIFPEGTMNKTNEPLSEFYDGAFRIAIQTQTPILPFVMVNGKNLLPRTNPLKARPGIIKVMMLPAIEVEGLTESDIPALKEKTYQIMYNALLSEAT
ncbi:lysophospholipid acyltransferase family protein [Pedobacter montanisoli]|uniref:1-acyl-sn-glycerol-3-phosphate acyltransferase n=1 Tax=Pedobacter montanisoli TaxID=2923277 RepID=A0ABS9ZV37_9SPHI|nr:lysophospholipid acyltransferase family protein [Pedobacter montanisoli]MCJ0741969.1 1-acyl-sn-glycerol-3-phosphate acyltransferase [Pedobacter montanisoli]